MEARMQAMDLDVIIREEEEDGWKILSTGEVPPLRGKLEIDGREKPFFVYCQNQGIAGMRRSADVLTVPPNVSLHDAQQVVVRIAYGPTLLHLAGGHTLRETLNAGDATLNIRYYRMPPPQP